MEITGRHRVPAAASRLWEALSDQATVRACLAEDVTLGTPGDERGLPVRIFDRPCVAAPIEAEAPRLASFRLMPAYADRPGWTARIEAALTQEGPFTLVAWRWLADGEAPDAERLDAAVNAFLARIGQHAAVPLTVAADGLSGVATTVADTLPSARETPFGPLLAQIAAWPRDLAIGGALFAVVLLIVVGII